MTSGTGQQFIAELGAWLNPRLTVEQVRVLRESRTGTYVVRFERPFAREPDVLLVGVPASGPGPMFDLVSLDENGFTMVERPLAAERVDYLAIGEGAPGRKPPGGPDL